MHHFVPIIHKNTPIPVTKSEVFFTVVERQEKVDVRIFQGEDPDALNNILIGRFLVEGLRKGPANDPVVLKLSLDLDGVLNVSAIEKETGLEKSITIDDALRRYDEEEVAQARARIGELFAEELEEAGEVLEGEAEGTDEAQHAVVQARAVVEKAERMLEQASPEDREDMVDLIETIKDAVAAGNSAALKKPVDELSDILYYLES